MWVYASRARCKLGRGRIRPGWTRALRPDLNKHAILVCAEIAGTVGVRVVDLEPEIFVSDDDDQELLAVLDEHGVPGDGFVIINPFSRWKSKTWPLERYVQVASQMRRHFQLPIVIAGGPGEQQHAEELMRLLPSGTATPLVGELSLGQALCLYRRALLMVTGDSGPMHAAAALGTRVVALFGPTLPERNGPWGEGHTVIQKSRPPFHHAYRSVANRMYLDAIDVETVYAAIAAALQPLLSERCQKPMPWGGPTTNHAIRGVP
jgi:ADP-heptose:LPS heptosyltransferase